MEMQSGMNEMTLRDYIRVLFRHKWVIIITAVTVVSAVALGALMRTPVYEAAVKILISGQKQAQAPYYTDIGIGVSRSAQITMTQTEIVISDPVLERAVSVLGLSDKPFDYEKRFSSEVKKPLIEWQARKREEELKRLSGDQKKAILFRIGIEDLRKRMKVDPVRDTDLFLIKVFDYNPLGAAVTANVVSRSYVIFDLEQQLAEMQLKYGEKHQSVVELEAAIEKMKKSLGGAPLSSIDAIGPATVKIIEQARVPLKAVGITRRALVGLGALTGAFLAVMLAFVFEYVDQTFRSPRDIETFLNIPFLGSIPKKKRLKKRSICGLSDRIYLMMKDNNLRSLLLAATLRKEKPDIVAADLAKTIAEKTGHTILIIDANLRRPSIHRSFNLENGPGLADIIEGKATFEKGARHIEGTLSVMTSGKSERDPVALLNSSAMKKVMDLAKARYDMVFMDCANLKDFQDGAVVSSYLDGTCLVINEGRTRRKAVQSAIASLQKKGINLVGAILNNRDFVIPGFVYHWI